MKCVLLPWSYTIFDGSEMDAVKLTNRELHNVSLRYLGLRTTLSKLSKLLKHISAVSPLLVGGIKARLLDASQSYVTTAKANPAVPGVKKKFERFIWQLVALPNMTRSHMRKLAVLRFQQLTSGNFNDGKLDPNQTVHDVHGLEVRRVYHSIFKLWQKLNKISKIWTAYSQWLITEKLMTM